MSNKRQVTLNPSTLDALAEQRNEVIQSAKDELGIDLGQASPITSLPMPEPAPLSNEARLPQRPDSPLEALLEFLSQPRVKVALTGITFKGKGMNHHTSALRKALTKS